MESFIQASLFEQQFSLWAIAAVFAAGLLTSLTPCVYPMIPITVSVVGSQASGRGQSILYSLLYVFGLALVYAALGVLAASSGVLFGTVASHPVTLLIVAAFCLLMAAWMLGWVRLPMGLITAELKSKSAPFNVFLAGALSGLVMAPCTSPVLGMLLMYVAGEGDRLWAALLMFVFAFGMSALLIVAGSFSGGLSMLPRSGPWL
ncbi:MAG: sulfite exporter TauE/SafE family protein, partial [Oleispira sp.]|nr:sulfite exporter TauE/SafE family protein [Oleispira sp.]